MDQEVGAAVPGSSCVSVCDCVFKWENVLRTNKVRKCSL